MIIVAIAALSLVVLTAVIAVFGDGLPSFPSEAVTYINMFISYLQAGAGIFFSFVRPNVVKTLFGLTVTVSGLISGYKAVMWVMKKIPMFGVSD